MRAGSGDDRERPTARAGVGDNRERPISGPATLPLRGGAQRESGFSRARTAEPLAEGLVEPGRGRRRLAVIVPVVAVVCGLVAGGLAGERMVGGERARPVAGPAGGEATAEPSDPKGPGDPTGTGSPAGTGNSTGPGSSTGAGSPAGPAGPLDQLRGTGTLLFTDPQGRAQAQTADRRDHRVLGQLGELALRRAPSGRELEAVAQLLAVPPDDRQAELAADGDLVYLRTEDAAAAVGRLADGSVRRLAPAGWRSPGPPRHSADGGLLGVCGYRLGGDPAPAVAEARSWLLDGSGKQLASLPGCLYDVAGDGRSALVADPAEGRRAGPVPGRGFARRPPFGASDQLTRGLRLWRRDGRFRPVLGFDDLVRAFRTVQPGVDPRGVVILSAMLGPDGRQALVRAADVLADVIPRTGREVELLILVDLERGRAEPVPEHMPGLFAFLPTGGLAWTGAATATYLPPDRPPQLLRSGIANESLYAIVPSPDGAWLLLAGAVWRFIRADDPSVQVSYPAPGRLAAWVP
jgi:hypothetical protein